MTGPPGAGKTTVARALADRFELSALVAGDDFFAFVNRGYVPPWTSEAHHQNEIVIQAAAVGRLATGGYTVIYDGVIGPWFLATFTAATGLERLHYLVLLPSEECCVARVQLRVGHGFTDADATRHMYQQFAAAEVDARHLVTGPPDDPEATVTSICERVANDSLVRSLP